MPGRSAEEVVRFAALLFGGVFAGFMATVLVLEISVRSFDGAVYIQVRQVELVALDTFATVTLIPAVVLTTLLVVAAFRRRSGDRWASTVALALWMLVLGTTLVINLPINARQLTWNAATPPVDWVSVRDRWQSAHAVRAVAAVLAFALLISIRSRSTPVAGAPTGARAVPSAAQSAEQ